MAGPLILVLDDEPPVRRLLVRILEKQGYGVRAVGTLPPRSISWIARRSRWVMTDLDMPGASEFDLIEALWPRTPEVATILVTGRGSTRDRNPARSGGSRGRVRGLGRGEGARFVGPQGPTLTGTHLALSFCAAP